MEMPVGKSSEAVDVRRLPVSPHVLLKLIDRCYRPDVDFEGLAKVIETDPVLTAKLFSISRFSSIKGFSLEQVQPLLAVLDIETVKSLAVTTAVNQMFTRRNDQHDQFYDRMRQQSLRCACIAESLAKSVGHSQYKAAYFAGLLHRIGDLMLYRRTHGGYAKVASIDLGHRRDDVEQENFGVSAAELGALLVRNWDPDSFISDAILFQNARVASILDSSSLVKLVHLANRLTVQQNLIDEETIATAQQLFELSGSDLSLVVSEAEDRLVDSYRSIAKELTGEERPQDVTDGRSSDTLTLKEARRQLTRRVRDFALLEGGRLHLERFSGLEDILEGVRKSLYILFGLNQAQFFRYEADSRLLRGHRTEQHKSGVEDLTIATDPCRSRLAEAVCKRKVLHTLEADDQELSVIDQQLIKICGNEGVLYLPLVNAHLLVGVLAIGISAPLWEGLKKQASQLVLFATEVARVIQRYQLRDQDCQEMIASGQQQQEQRIRELVHEAGNPLSIISNYLEIVGIELGEDHQVQGQIEVVREEIGRISDILQQMRQPPEERPLPVGTIDLNRFLEKFVVVIKKSMTADKAIKIRLELDETLGPVHSNPNSLKQIFTNLVKNAMEALENKGMISLATRANVNVDGRHYVEIVVGDDGPGILDSDLNRLFHPLESRKGKDHSGLGLTIVKNLIAELHGSISCRSQVDQGTEFRILLPQ